MTKNKKGGTDVSLFCEKCKIAAIKYQHERDLEGFLKGDWKRMNIDCILNIDWAMYIDWLLRILQTSTFIGVILKISFQNKAYINNIEIQVIKPIEFDSLHTRFHHIYEFKHDENDKHSNHLIFYPKEVDIEIVEFYSLIYDSKSNRLVDNDKLHTVKNLKNYTCLLIHTNLPENMPSLRMKWKTSQGEIGEYTFYSNMYNGNVNISSFKYKLTLKRKLLALFGL